MDYQTRRQNILALLAADSREWTSRAVASALDDDRFKVQIALGQLAREGLVKRLGKNRGARWQILLLSRSTTMAVQNGFEMSEATRSTLMAGLDGLSKAQKSQILSAVASLAAEIQIHCRIQAFEELRHQWADTLGTMFLVEPAKKV